MGHKTANVFCVAGMIVSWSAYMAISKWAVGETESAFLAGLLLRSAALVFLTIQLLAQRKLRKLFCQGHAVPILFLIGVFGYLLDTFANIGYRYGSLSTGTALLKTDVLMVNIATVVVYKKRLRAVDWIGTCVMLIGTLFVLQIDWANMRLNWYDLFFIASAFAVTVNAFTIKSAQDKYGIDTDMIAYYNNFTVLTLFLVSTLINGDIRGALSRTDSGFWGIIALGGLSQACIYFFYYRSLKRYEVWIVKLYLLLMPVLSCVIGVLVFDESFSAGKLAGIAIVLLGACIILLRDRILSIYCASAFHKDK